MYHIHHIHRHIIIYIHIIWISYIHIYPWYNKKYKNQIQNYICNMIKAIYIFTCLTLALNRDRDGVMSPKWWHRTFPIPPPHTIRTTNNYSWTRHHCENPRTWRWGWSTPCTTETKTDHIRRVRGATPRWPHCPCPRLVKHHMERSPLSLWFLQRQKRAQAGHPASPLLWLTSWESHSCLASGGSQGNLWSLTTGNQIVMEKGGGLVGTRIWILADQVPTSST